MRPGLGFLPQDAVYPFKGLNTVEPSTFLSPSYSPSSLNAQTQDGVVKKRKGYVKLGNDVVGVVQNIAKFESVSGVRSTILLTTKRQYVFNLVLDLWVDITKRSTEYDIDAVSTGSKTFTISDDGDLSSTFPDGHPFYVSGSTGNDGTYTIASTSYSAPDFVVTVVETIPSATADGGGKTVVEFTGDQDDVMNWVHGTDNNGRKLIITNGVDTPRIWTGTDEFIDWAPTYTNFVTCKTLEIFFDHLVLGNITLTGPVNNPQLLAWSDTADFNQFQTGNSGSNFLADSLGPIKTLKVLSDRLILYSSDSIAMMSFIGGDAIFRFDQVLRESRLFGPLSIISLGFIHVLLNGSGFQIFDGSRQLKPIATLIQPTIRDNLVSERANRVFGYDNKTEKILSFIVEDYVFIADYSRGFENLVWDRFVYTDTPTCIGTFLVESDPVWTDFEEAWSEVEAAWDSFVSEIKLPKIIIGTNGEVFTQTSDTIDDGVDYSFDWQTKDFTIPREYISRNARWLEVEFEARGVDIDVSYSTDKGVTKTLIQSVALNTRFTVLKIPFDVRSETLRIHFNSTNSDDFQVRWVRLWFKEGSPR